MNLRSGRSTSCAIPGQSRLKGLQASGLETVAVRKPALLRVTVGAREGLGRRPSDKIDHSVVLMARQRGTLGTSWLAERGIGRGCELCAVASRGRAGWCFMAVGERLGEAFGPRVSLGCGGWVLNWGGDNGFYTTQRWHDLRWPYAVS